MTLQNRIEVATRHVETGRRIIARQREIVAAGRMGRQHANANFTPEQVWSLKQAVGAMGEVQLGAKLNDKEENDMVGLTCS